MVMEIKVACKEQSSNREEQKRPLLMARQIAEPEIQSPIQKAISQTFQSTAHLANLLPTGTVLTFQLLAPVFSNQGNCDPVCRFMTAALVALCGISCFLLSFSDSFRDGNGKICYGLATFRGLWVIDGSAKLPCDLDEEYRLRFIDFAHAIMSILVFAAVALFDQSVVDCFYPAPDQETKELLTSVPVGIGVICSMLFIVFPSKRHGIGFPLSTQ